MSKSWADVIEQLSYCNLYKAIGVNACINCDNAKCKHVKKDVMTNGFGEAP